jgi:hypothetical protein
MAKKNGAGLDVDYGKFHESARKAVECRLPGVLSSEIDTHC